ncbi:MAG: DUF3141 domain-containing protein [Burkholderiaceae bacterium]|nr:DUF3141 domain-containing protein [Burkholderiaceae bacterium]
MPTNTQYSKTKPARVATTAARPSPTSALNAASVESVAPKAQAATDSARAWGDAWSYYVDSLQRGVLFLDVLRERGDNMLAHERAGQPPLLDFEHELVLDARTFDKPANYALLHITRCGPTHASDFERQDLRPVLVIDPRAGHGPGIGGFKHDSEVGVALHEGHPTYFASFFPEPCPGQTLGDVIHALRAFVEEIVRRHGGVAPVLYGNCQGGWAVALLAAECEGLDGPAVLNGSPLSYWAGAEDVNPMRLAGGLLGGEWLTHLMADLGGGRLDGAWLVQNFEGLNPANTWWQKNYNLYANVDTERERFLEFERWWSSYFFLSREEILATVENLFIGNRLEQGQVQLDPCEMADPCVVDLKRIRNPMVIFSSSGDNITPPHQALAWLPAIYPDTAALKASGQRIVYLLNPHVGHLGIFVSASVAQHEHRAILENIEAFKNLAPGLYEMKIGEPVKSRAVRGAGKPAGDDTPRPRHKVWFEERRVEDLQFSYPRQAFEKVAAVSQWNELAYRNWVSPWIKLSANPVSAFMQKWGHPMRLQRYLFSPQVTPAMAWVTFAAAWAREFRQPASEDNPWRLREEAAGKSIAGSLEQWRVQRDDAEEHLFTTLYGRS